ncbi:MAG: hypothetical protein AAFN78_09415, partial [Pseudomonadota bacterium]
MNDTLHGLCAALALAVLAGAPLANAATDTDDPLAANRAIFKKAYPKARAGQRSAYTSNRSALKDYPLLPDLHGAWLRSQVGKSSADDDIAAYLDTYGDLSPARALRYRWLKSLYKRKRWDSFLAVEHGVRTVGVVSVVHGQE